MSQVEVPKTLGSFRVEALHAKGGRADIYRVTGPLQTVHAAKLERLPSPRPHDRPHDFELEYMILSQAKSPYLLASTAHGTWRNRHYLIVDFLAGVTLKELLQSTKPYSLSPIALIDKIAQATNAIHQLVHEDGHEIGAIHGDLGPHNILIHPKTGDPTVLDLESVRFQAPQSAHLNSAKGGSLAFSPPEQHMGSFSQSADVFSLGALLFLLFTGQSIYLHKDSDLPPRSWRTRHVDSIMARTDYASWAPLIQKAVALDPKERHPNAAAFIQHLERTREQHGDSETLRRNVCEGNRH